MKDSNFYFETLQQIQGELSEEAIISRMSECNIVLTEIAQSKLWDILLKDSNEMVKKLDDAWQDFPEGAVQLKEARVIKMASRHVLDLPMKYAQELDYLTAQLHKIQNPDEVIQKDTDNE